MTEQLLGGDRRAFSEIEKATDDATYFAMQSAVAAPTLNTVSQLRLEHEPVFRISTASTSGAVLAATFLSDGEAATAKVYRATFFAYNALEKAVHFATLRAAAREIYQSPLMILVAEAQGVAVATEESENG